MTRLIEEEEAFKVLSAYYKHRYYEQDEALLDALSRVPTVDAVPVIRCRDCKYNPKTSYTGCPMAAVSGRTETDYCSRAERRGER